MLCYVVLCDVMQNLAMSSPHKTNEAKQLFTKVMELKWEKPVLIFQLNLNGNIVIWED